MILTGVYSGLKPSKVSVHWLISSFVRFIFFYKISPRVCTIKFSLVNNITTKVPTKTTIVTYRDYGKELQGFMTVCNIYQKTIRDLWNKAYEKGKE